MNCKIKESVKLGITKKTEEWHFSLPWSYSLLKFTQYNNA